MGIKKDVLDWLLEEKNPSVRYRTLTELLDYGVDAPSVREARAQIPGSKAVRRIFAKMHPKGYWLHRDKGRTVDYAMSASTHFMLAYLAELGLDKEDKHIQLAVERYLDLDPPDFYTHQSCLYAYNLRTFVMLGYQDDARIKKRVEVLLADKRFDGGYLCERKTFTEKTKSCIRGSIKALTAFAALPELWHTSRCQQLVDYFLRRRVFYRTDQPETIIRDELVNVKFPFVIAGSLLEPLLALSMMGYGQDAHMEDAWQQLATKQDATGRYLSDGHSNTFFRPGKKGEPSKWITLYALLALKYREVTSEVVQCY